MGVFTTQTLLSSLGVSRNRSAPGAVAINWILKVQIPSQMNNLYGEQFFFSLTPTLQRI